MTYTAITIGPIYDTISLTSSPAGLWAVSYMFSHVSRRLCELISDKLLIKSEEKILSPFFNKNDQLFDGIGRYHDHIVFKPANSETVLTELETLFEQVAKELAAAFEGDTAEWFKQYLQLHAVCYDVAEGGNPILACSKYLDAIELEKTFPTIAAVNPLADLLDSKDDDRNIRIRNTIRNSFSAGVWSFPKYYTEKGKERLPEMADITGRSAETAHPRRKIKSYYAIVQTDGDNFSRYIEGLTAATLEETERAIRTFSEKCLKYCTDSAALVKAYGGVPIYAGGDDLMFIAPLEGNNGDILLKLLVDLRKKFDETFYEKEGDPTLSLGAVLRYYKYPLYEAFDEAYTMLNSRAKKTKNTAVISLQKHSGQSSEFVLEDFKSSKLTEKVEQLIEMHICEDVLHSVQSKIWEFEKLFRHALFVGDRDSLKNLFDNTFDSEIHKNHAELLTQAYELLSEIKPPQTLVETLTEDYKRLGEDRTETQVNSETRLITLDSLLRFAKFWGEEGDDGDA